MVSSPGQSKPALFFVPHYIGSFKYYEKLIPFLRDRYDIYILLLFTCKKFFAEMKDYARLKGYVTKVIEPPRPFFMNAFPPFAFTRDLLYFRREVRRLFNETVPLKIISPNDSGPFIRFLFEEAHRRDIETLVLQWAMTYEGSRERIRKQGSFLRRVLYRILKPLYVRFKLLAAAMFLGSDLNISKDLTGKGNSDRVGVINRQAFDYLLSHGVARTKLSVVGYLDYHFSQTVKETLDRDPAERTRVAERLGIDLRKKLIVFFSSPFNGKDINVLSDAEQFALTERAMMVMRKVFKKEDFDIALKIHPSESLAFYAPLERLGVKLYDKDTNNYELVYFSDLYVAANTAANFMPLIMGKEVIFVNFLNLSVVNASQKVFNVKKFVTDYDEFQSLLGRFKDGTLERQYSDVENITTPDSLRKILDWIG